MAQSSYGEEHKEKNTKGKMNFIKSRPGAGGRIKDHEAGIVFMPA